MTPAWLALLLLASPHYRAEPALAPALAVEIVRQEKAHGLPSLLLAAVVLHESGGRLLVSARRYDGRRDYGPAQIHLGRTTRPVHDPRTLAGNLAEGARLLALSRATCAAHPRWAACRRSSFSLYNSGSERWWRRVERIWRRLKAGREVTS